jgi:UDP-N-acetylglucosamine 2-epimerase (non-hydrolysing)
MKKIMLAFGTRPEAIKMAPLVQALEKHPDFGPQVVVTAQYREILDQILALFEITPHVDLNLMQPGQTLAAFTSRIIDQLTRVIGELNLDSRATPPKN